MALLYRYESGGRAIETHTGAKEMEMATLGKTGLRVSRLGAGLAEIGSVTDVSVASRLLNIALDGGINFLDTAACYGNSEEWIGQTISHRRQEYILATKAGHVTGGYDGQEWTARTILDSIERSLKRMRTNYLDLVQLHSCGIEILNQGEVIQALLDAKQAGKVRFVGYSGGGEAARWAVESGQFDTLQITFNLIDQWARLERIPKAKANGMGIIAKRPIANAAWGAPESSDSVREGYRQGAQAMLGMGPIPKAPRDPILLALGFVLAHEEVDTAIVGTRNPDHMGANIELVESQLRISAQVVEELHRRFRQLELKGTPRSTT
jgi:aryl-alcohol dehydrogenase-like predicted oxidoreductase